MRLQRPGNMLVIGALLAITVQSFDLSAWWAFGIAMFAGWAVNDEERRVAEREGRAGR